MKLSSFSFYPALFVASLLCASLAAGQSTDQPKTSDTLAKSDVKVEEVTPAAVKKKLDQGESFILVDVRDQHEWDAGHIQGAWLIPLSKLDKRLNELDQSREIVVYCRSGKRSDKAARILLDSGFTNVRNMKGGILSWIDQVDPSLPKN